MELEGLISRASERETVVSQRDLNHRLKIVDTRREIGKPRPSPVEVIVFQSIDAIKKATHPLKTAMISKIHRLNIPG